MFKSFKIKIDNNYYPVEFENYKNIVELDAGIKEKISKEINSILIDSWGKFPNDFIENHILNDKDIIIARYKNEYIGFCVLNIKKILNKKVHYIEFLVIKKYFQKSNLGSHLFYLIIKDSIFKNIIKMIFWPLEIMFITPNVRTITRLSRFVNFIYPNPYLAKKDGSINQADNLTWEMAKALISQSDNPKRKLNRDGLVLENSYTKTPWLIYNSNNAPWHNNENINKFAQKYIGYNGEDKEFVVRAHINLQSLIKYLYHYIFKI